LRGGGGAGDVVPRTPGHFNRTGRGYPDVAALGAEYLVVCVRGRL